MNNYFYSRIFAARKASSGNGPLFLGIALILIGLFVLLFPEILVLFIGGSIIWVGITMLLWAIRLKRNGDQHQDTIHINIKN